MERDDIDQCLRIFHRNYSLKNSTQIRNLLPIEITHKTIMFIRAQACLKSSAGKIECLKWTCRPKKIDLETSFYEHPRLPISKTNEYVCNKCRHPKLSISAFIDSVFLHEINDKISDRSFRRYINNSQKVSYDFFTKILANAFFNGWIELRHTKREIYSARKFHIFLQSMIAIRTRLDERKSSQYTTTSFYIEIEKELLKQERLFKFNEIANLHKKLESKIISLNFAKAIQEVIADSYSQERNNN